MWLHFVGVLDDYYETNHDEVDRWNAYAFGLAHS